MIKPERNAEQLAAIESARIRMVEAMALLDMAGAGSELVACYLQAAIDAVDSPGAQPLPADAGETETRPTCSRTDFRL